MLANDKTIRAVHIFSTMGQSHGHINGTRLPILNGVLSR